MVSKVSTHVTTGSGREKHVVRIALPTQDRNISHKMRYKLANTGEQMANPLGEMIWCWAAEVDFLPPAQLRVLPELPSKGELLAACHCLKVSDAQITALLNTTLALSGTKRVHSSELVCDLTTVPVTYWVVNSDKYIKMQEGKQLHQDLSQMPVNSTKDSRPLQSM